jgi:hypothetical protein
MADMWSYPEGVGRVDVTGYDVEALDGEVGTVDEATLESGASYLVVDTGRWILGKKVLIPAALVERIDRDEETVYVGQTKEEIEGAPEFDNDRYKDAGYRESVGAYYAAMRTRREEASS